MSIDHLWSAEVVLKVFGLMLQISGMHNFSNKAEKNSKPGIV
jgi:hypothetical protein